MRRVTSAGVRESNLKCDVAHEVKGDQTPPTVHVTFSKCMCVIVATCEWLMLSCS